MEESQRLIEVKKELEKFKNAVIKESRNNLKNMRKDTFGKLSKSLRGQVKVSKNSFEFDFTMEEYGMYQDKGVSGTKKKYNTPYKYTNKMMPTKALDKWIVKKGLAPRNEKGKFISRQGLKFAIARKIYINGIKPSLFFTKPFEKYYKKLPNQLIEKYGLDLDKFISFSLKDLK
jgi:hypothetical protein